MPSFDFGAAFRVFAHTNSASRIGFSCSKRFCFRSLGEKSLNCSSNWNKLVYPRREELRFVESVDTLTEENFLKFLKGREQIVLKAFIGGLYSDN